MLTYAFEKGFSLSGQVQSIAFSHNGKYLAVALDDQVCVWNTTTWLLELRFRRDAVPVRAITWDGGGRLFFACDSGFLTMVTFTEKEYLSEGFCASERPIHCVAVNARGDLLAMGGGDEVTIWSSQVDSRNSRTKWKFVRQLNNPQDKHDKTTINVSGIAWVDGSSTQLVVSYDKQGVVTWDTSTNSPLFKAGKIFQNEVRSSRTDAPKILVGGGAHFAVPSGRDVRVYFRENGRDFRCLTSSGTIPWGSPIIWAHDGTCIIAALERTIVLLHIEKRREATLSIEDCAHVSCLSWNKSRASKGPMYRLALVTNGNVLRVFRATATNGK